jgi:hypothetical protein
MGYDHCRLVSARQANRHLLTDVRVATERLRRPRPLHKSLSEIGSFLKSHQDDLKAHARQRAEAALAARRAHFEDLGRQARAAADAGDLTAVEATGSTI